MKTVWNALLASVAFAVVAGAAAQTSAPKPSTAERQRDVANTTEAGSGNSASTQKTAKQQAENVRKSKDVSKMSKQEKSKLAKDATKLNVNPENSAGQAATSHMQKDTVPASKSAGKQNADLRTKEGKAGLEKEMQQKSSP